jgi:hypothetical protein
MAKSKWEKLSLAISLMLKGIERYIQDVDRTVSKYNLISFCFKANSICLTQSNLDYSKYVCMANTYRIFFGIFSLNLNLKKELEKPFLDYPQVYQPLERSQTQKTITRTWSVKIQPAEKIIYKLINLPLELLLYCPLASEYEECNKWFGKENQTLFLFDIMHSLSIEAAQEAKILNNLAQPIEKHFTSFIKSKTTSTNSRQSFSFKPSSEESLKTALEKAIICRSNRKIGQAYDLFKDWEELLQALTFKDIDWSIEVRNACLLRMKIHVKYNSAKLGQDEEPGYTQTAGDLFRERMKDEIFCFDKCTIAKVILWFAEKCIHDHHDRKSAQIVCILWLSIWLSREMGDEAVPIEKIINLSSKEININSKSLVIDDIEIKISRGLMNLLFILIGKGKGLRTRRLFPDINKRNLKYTLKSVFQTIFPDHPTAFSLDSLLFFPHQFVGSILPASLLKKMRNPDALAGKTGDLKGCLLKGYKNHSSH